MKLVEPLPRAGAKGVKPEIKPVGRRGKFYQFTAIDDCMLKIYPKNNQKTAIQFLDYTYPMRLRAATPWYHDHRMDSTGPHIWRGLAGFPCLYSRLYK